MEDETLAVSAGEVAVSRRHAYTNEQALRFVGMEVFADAVSAGRGVPVVLGAELEVGRSLGWTDKETLAVVSSRQDVGAARAMLDFQDAMKGLASNLGLVAQDAAEAARRVGEMMQQTWPQWYERQRHKARRCPCHPAPMPWARNYRRRVCARRRRR